jgi:FMN-dependent oxidoreductase (nitrilotriacetate monooxygenase family)
VSADGLHLVVNVAGAGYHPGAWREDPDGTTAFIDIEHYQRAADIAERGLFDALLLADIPSQNPGISRGPTHSLEPTLICASLAVSTDHIGFIPTVSTSFNDPYNLARRILSLDLASGGRGGWNAVTTAMPLAAGNFGQDGTLPREDRYRRAAEFVELSIGLWDSWEDGALVGDQASGEFADARRIHEVGHRGEFFNVQGPMNVPRSPQGRPVTVQAGASDPGMRFAARYADVVYGSQLSLSGAIEFAAQIRALASDSGRDPASIRFLPALVPVVGATVAAAEARWEQLQASRPPAATEAAQLEDALWLSPGSLERDLDAPIDPALFERGRQLHEGFIRAAVRFARDTGASPRELGRSIVGGHRVVIGDPIEVADHIEEWWRSGAVDGFTLAPPAVPHDLEQFVELVVPELQRRGIYRSEYPGATLRENLGLPVPENVFTHAVGSRS